MANSTFQSITGPSGPEGIKAIGVTGNSGDTGGIGATGPEAPFVSQYRWSEVDPSNGEERIKLTLSDESVVYVGGVSGQNAYVAGVTALGESVGNPSGQIFKQTTTAGPDPSGATFQFRGLTAAVDLGIEWADDTISISSPIGITTGYVDSGSTGEFLFLSPQYKAQGGSGSFYDSFGGPNPTGTGDTISVKFRNAIAHVGDEYNIDFCNTAVANESGDKLKEYILDVANLVRFSPPEENGKRFGYLCVSVKFFQADDRIVILRTKVDNNQDTETIRQPLYGASEVNFENPLSGELLYVSGENNSGEGYGNDSYRRSIISFNTPYENLNEGYEAGIHPQVWSGSTGAPAVDYPSEQAVIFDTNCIDDDTLEGKLFRGKPFCSDPESELGNGTHSYCLRIEEDMFESQNTSSPWYGKIRMVVMPGCGNESGSGTQWKWKISCESVCSCRDAGTVDDNPYGACCTSAVADCDSLSGGPISGRLELDITNADVFNVAAPIDIAGITWSYDQRPGLSLGSNDGNNFGEMKNITVIVEGGPNNIKFPDNVKFAGTPTFTNGIDIVNLLTVDNGDTWFATQTGYGWDVDIFKEDRLGSCCSGLGCVNFVNKTYCDELGGSFEEDVPCYRRTDPECGAGITGGCCSGLEGTINTGVLCDDSGDYTPPADYVCCSDDAGCLPGPEDFGSYIGCLYGQCESCCGGNLNFEFCDDLCTLPLQKCCFDLDPESSYCVTITDGCNSCEELGGREVQNCSECNLGNDNLFKCCAPCPIGCVDVPNTESCTALQGRISNTGLCSACLGPEYDDIYGGTDGPVGRPKCLLPSTLLQCNLINGYFVPSTVTEDPCTICETINVCDPPPVGACCDDTNGDCRGIMLEEVCDAIKAQNPELNITWLGAGSECDDCCGNQEFRGACCFCNENCVPNLTPQECSSLRGIFMGIDSTCGSVNCSIAGPCECPCEITGCCDCPAGHPSRSPCCDDPQSEECCDSGDWCGDDDDDDDSSDDPNDTDDTEEFEIPLFPGDSGKRGPGTPRSDWTKGACCQAGAGCHRIFVGSRLTGPVFGPFDPAEVANERCSGTFTPEATCQEVNCKKQKYTGACCCATWSIKCPNEDQEDDGLNGCQNCEVDDVKITCTNCEFDGNKPGFGRPVNGRGGGFLPPPPNYPPIFVPPNGDKRPIRPKPLFTPGGNKVPYNANACCKNKGGCKPAPCTIEDRIYFADNFDPPVIDSNDCVGIIQDTCTELTQICGDTRDEVLCDRMIEVAEKCGTCGPEVCQPFDGDCVLVENTDKSEISPDTGIPKYLEDLAAQSNCEMGCDCLPQPTCSTPNKKCEDKIQSTCRFIYDYSSFASPSTRGTACDKKLITPPSKVPNKGTGRDPGYKGVLPFPGKPPYEADPNSICERNGKVFGRRLRDGSGNPSPGYASPFYISNVNRQSTASNQSSVDFRQINTISEVNRTTLNNTTVISFRLR